jgi:hypothetical protein
MVLQLSLLLVEEVYGTQYHIGSFSLINVGTGFHCLRSWSLGHEGLCIAGKTESLIT